ncbi:hypothetical protein B0H14DRAFT_3586273 [Mycena olivaceomarginata]|nr:hypothetical protein B0H14DRAFT_3586273 [Mycena olivaceomarginata]
MISTILIVVLLTLALGLTLVPGPSTARLRDVRKVDDEEALIVAFASHTPSSDTHCLTDARQVEFTPTRIYAVDMDLDHERLIPSLNPGILKKWPVFPRRWEGCALPPDDDGDACWSPEPGGTNRRRSPPTTLAQRRAPRRPHSETTPNSRDSSYRPKGQAVSALEPPLALTANTSPGPVFVPLPPIPASSAKQK